jgi:hypothetical protein
MLKLTLTELRLPTIESVWAAIAVQSDKEAGALRASSPRPPPYVSSPSSRL